MPRNTYRAIPRPWDDRDYTPMPPRQTIVQQMKDKLDLLESDNIDLKADLANAKRKVKAHEILLNRIATQLRKWATESRVGGWSTHQVAPQRELANQIDDALS